MDRICSVIRSTSYEITPYFYEIYSDHSLFCFCLLSYNIVVCLCLIMRPYVVSFFSIYVFECSYCIFYLSLKKKKDLNILTILLRLFKKTGRKPGTVRKNTKYPDNDKTNCNSKSNIITLHIKTNLVIRFIEDPHDDDTIGKELM